MRNWILPVLALGALTLYFKRSRVETDASFSASYLITEESGVSNTGPEEREVAAVVDGARFALHSTASDMSGGRTERWQIYDGKNLHEKSVYHPVPSDGQESVDPEPVEVHSQEPAEQELLLARFWARTFQGDAGEGEAVAGRKTRLYQARSQLPDRTVTIRAWLDAENGVVLKSEESIYARQVETLLVKITVECKSISYGPQDPAAFQRPD